MAFLALVVMLIAGAPGAGAASPETIERVFPAGDRTVDASDLPGPPPVTRITSGGELLGYVFSTRDVVGSIGYSGKPIDIVVGLSVDGTLTGAQLVAHQEPILIIGISSERLSAYVSDFTGYDIRKDATVTGGGIPEVVSGASVSSAVIRNAIIRSARTVANTYGLLGQSPDDRRLDRASFAEASWSDLTADKSIARRTVTQRNYASALPAGAAGGADAPDPDSLFIELIATLVTPARIGQNLLGKRAF
ncbi:MAG: FMN-binding protein, partial [Hyphomicrobiales bacterium]